jgi:hypothetical protein
MLALRHAGLRLARLLALGAHLVPRTHLVLRTLRTLGRSESLACHPLPAKGLALLPLNGMPTAAAAATLLRVGSLTSATATVIGEGGLAVPAATAAVRPRIRRGCDRQRGYAGSEKNPGHNLSPSNGKNGPLAPPFQPLDGWSLHPIAPG